MHRYFKLPPIKYFIVFYFSIAVSVFIGCAKHGPVSLKSERNNYNLAIQKTNDQQLLLNLVRLKYRDTPFFMEVSNVASQFSLQKKASITAQLEDMANDIFNLGASTTYEEKPTISYSPLQGDKFVQNILSMLPLKTIALLFHSGWSVERIFRISFQRLNSLENALGAAGPTPQIAPRFREFLKAAKLLRELQIKDALNLTYREDNGQPQLVLQILKEFKNSKTAIEFARAVNVEPEATNYILSSSRNPDQPNHIRVVTRSFLGIMFYLSQSVQVPEIDIKRRKVTLTRTPGGQVFDWQEVTNELLSIYSRQEEPDQSSIRIYFRDSWFYIDDSDLESKSTFSLLAQIYSLQSGRIKSNAPLLTIGVGS